MRAEIEKNYYPFTEACGTDGKPCLTDQCKYWLGDQKCWRYDFGEICREIFGEYDLYIFLKNEQGEPLDNPRLVELQMSGDREDFSKPVIVTVELGFTSERLAGLVREKFGLSEWTVEARNFEEGDDHNLQIKIPSPPYQREELSKFLKEIHEKIPAIIQFCDEVSICSGCGGKSNALNIYKGHALCFFCEKAIIMENVERYISEAATHKK